MLALCASVNPSDEVVLFDPYFVAYPHIVRLAGGVPVFVDSYPDFTIDIDRTVHAPNDRSRAEAGL